MPVKAPLGMTGDAPKRSFKLNGALAYVAAFAATAL
jgi:hypothetical protein